jgi:hypothetical protein
MGLSKTLEDLMRNQPLFQVTNHHGEACGVPPQIDEQTFPGVYRSYFENQNGEQAIFLYDYKQEHGTLYLGDAGWEHLFDVVDGKVLELVLTHPEERRLQTRLIKHKNWIFTFITYPDVPPDNNSSERAIKAAKVKAKVSGGFRSAPGASRFAQLLSLTQTLRKQKLAILPTLTAIFQGNEGAVSLQSGSG